MDKKNIFSIIVIVVIVLGGWYVYQGVFKEKAVMEKAGLYQGKIIIGTETWPGYIAFYVARDKGFFEEAGLDVKIKRYIALGELSKDYVAGAMQGRANLTLDAVNEVYQGLDHKVVLAIDYSLGSDAIIATKDIKTISDFKGKRVGYESGTLEEFFVVWALQQSGLSLSDVIHVEGNPEETAQLIEEGAIDVAVSHEPFLSQILKSENIHTVYSSKDAPGLITDILTFRSDFIEEYPETVQQIVNIYFKALNVWKENPEEAHSILALEFEDTQEGVALQLEGVTLLDERNNKTAFTFASGLQSLYGNMRNINDFVHKHLDTSAEKIDTDKIITKQFIRNINK